MLKRYKLGEYVLDAEAQLLSKDGDRVHLTGLPLQVLTYLIENRDRLVSRTELLEQFWEGREVYDDSLRKAVGTIRKSLADNATQPRFIETRRAGGYRYIGPFVPLAENETSDWPSNFNTSAKVKERSTVGFVIEEQKLEAEAARNDLPRVSLLRLKALPPGFNRRASTVVSIFGLSVLLVVTLIFLSHRKDTDALPIRSIAVLPLKNLSGDPAQEYLSDGLTEHLLNTLARIEGLHVIARGSAFTFKDQAVDLQEVGKRLGVSAILNGSVLKRGDRLRVEVRLVSTVDGRVLWASDTAEHTLDDIFAVQDEIARRVVAGMQINLNAADEQQLARHYTKNAASYQASLKGDYFRNQRTSESLMKAIEAYQQALKIDPHYLPAYLGLASSFYMGIWYIPLDSREATAQAKAALAKALEIDDRSSEAHVALAGFRTLEWDWAGSLQAMMRAKELNPSFSDYGYAYQLLLNANRPDEAVRWIKHAAELDPLSPLVSANVAEILYLARRYDDAITQAQKTLDLDPNYAMAHTHLGLAYVQKGRYDEAIAAFQKAIALSDRSPDLLARLALAYAAAGSRSEAQHLLTELAEVAKQRHVPPYRLAEIYVALGDKDQAFAQLEQAFQAHEMHLCNLKVEPTLDALRADARFADLVQRVGLAR